MSTILHIETSTDVCSVAVSQDGKCIFEREERVDIGCKEHAAAEQKPRRGSAVMAGVFVDEALTFTDQHLIDLDAVAVSSGPGSYTGLRVGTSMAKGVCYGQGLPLISVPTLELLCVPVLLSEKVKEENALLCPMIDARRMEVYAQLFDRSLHEVRAIQADVVDADTYREWLDERPVYFFGNGAAKCMDTINHPNARLIEGVEPLARWMFPLAERRFFQEKFEDVAYFVPFYLKDFVAKQPKKLL
jgi:tRNA threonylcarbamoyladenosine biosynthesis protein TsaB